MSATIRLARHGAKKSPFYRIVVSDRRFAADGRRLEQVGLYDPRQTPSRIEFKADRLVEWLQRGAQPSETVSRLIEKSGVLREQPESSAESQPAAEPISGETS
jgi:small subunit ribosomal protein S16